MYKKCANKIRKSQITSSHMSLAQSSNLTTNLSDNNLDKNKNISSDDLPLDFIGDSILDLISNSTSEKRIVNDLIDLVHTKLEAEQNNFPFFLD